MRLLVNIVAWLSLAIGGTSTRSCVLMLADGPRWKNQAILYHQLVTSALLALAGVGLVFKRHWGRRLWIATMAFYSTSLLILNIQDIVFWGMYLPLFTVLFGVIFWFGTRFLIRVDVKTIFR